MTVHPSCRLSGRAPPVSVVTVTSCWQVVWSKCILSDSLVAPFSQKQSQTLHTDGLWQTAPDDLAFNADWMWFVCSFMCFPPRPCESAHRPGGVFALQQRWCKHCCHTQWHLLSPSSAVENVMDQLFTNRTSEVMPATICGLSRSTFHPVASTVNACGNAISCGPLPQKMCQCNTLTCLQLATHRASSCGTHRVVTQSGSFTKDTLLSVSD